MVNGLDEQILCLGAFWIETGRQFEELVPEVWVVCSKACFITPHKFVDLVESLRGMWSQLETPEPGCVLNFVRERSLERAFGNHGTLWSTVQLFTLLEKTLHTVFIKGCWRQDLRLKAAVVLCRVSILFPWCFQKGNRIEELCCLYSFRKKSGKVGILCFSVIAEFASVFSYFPFNVSFVSNSCLLCFIAGTPLV